MDSKREDAAAVIHSFAAGHAVVAFLLANTLVGDTAVLTALTFAMVTALGKIYGITELSPRKIVSKIFGLVAGTYIAGKLLFWLPGIGNWANAMSTIFVTETIGWTCVAFFSTGRDPVEANSQELKSAVNDAKEAAKKYKEEAKVVASKMTSEEKKEIRDLSNRLRDSNISSEEQDEVTQKIKAIYARAKART